MKNRKYFCFVRSCLATYKIHKSKYRWLTNAFATVFSNIATLLSITSSLILESFKEFAKMMEQSFHDFLQVKTSMYWIINSSVEATLNFPKNMKDIFVADITCCYESIPLEGNNNLLDAIKYITLQGYKHVGRKHPRAVTCLWVRLSYEGIPIAVKWATNSLGYSNWFQLTSDRLICLHAWLMKNCYVILGDRVWRQRSRIPMGFSCSPIWCNMYLLAYEAKFIMRLAKLERKDLLSKFQSIFRYIDDLCLINVQNPQQFLSPEQSWMESNPFYIYPLNVLEIKEETSTHDPENLVSDISAHFMNVEIKVNTTLPDAYTFRKYDKKRALPFKYTQYIKFKSNRSVKQACNIAISQLVPILYISNRDEEAISEILILITTMTEKGSTKIG